MPNTIRLVDPDGVERDVSTESAAQYLQDPRWRISTPEDTAARVSAQAKEVDYGGVGGGLKATGTAFLRGATLGLSDVAARGIYGDEAAIDLSGLREVNPGLSTAGEIAGALAPAVVSGGTLAPAGLAARAGRGVAAIGEGAGAAGRIGAATLGGAAEGSLYGLGTGVSELALSTDPLTSERAASVLSSNMLFGAGAGALGGAAFKAAEEGLGAARGAIDDWRLRRSEARAMKAVGELETAAAAEHAAIGPETDVTLLDRKGLRVAREQELEAIKAAQAPEREGFVDALKAAHDERKAMYDWLAIVGDRNEEKAARDAAAIIFKTDRKIRDALNDRVGLSERPDRALGLLRTERQALGHLSEVQGIEGNRYFDRVHNAPEQVRKELMANEIPGFVVGKGGISPTSPVIDDIVAREVQARFPIGPDGLRIPPRDIVGFLDGSVDRAISRNDQLQQQLVRLSAPPASPRLDAIEAAEHALSGRTAAPKPEPEVSLGGALLSAAAPFAGPIGAVAASGTRAIGALRKAIDASAERAANAASSLLGIASKGAAAAEPYAPVLATKILSALRYSDRQEQGHKDQAKDLAKLYAARAGEIADQVQVAPDGSYQMRPDARAKMAAKFDGIRQHNPLAADRMEEKAAQRIEWLASQRPTRPDAFANGIGPSKWQPSDMDMRSWARKAAAVEDPYGVLERVANGTVTPEDALAMHAVYGEIVRDYMTQITGRLPELRKSLPYNRKLALSIFTGVPVDPALDPTVLRVLQGQFPAEPGSAGGTQAPKSMPQYGAIQHSVNESTPAQERQGAHV